MKVACVLLPDFEVAAELLRRPELAGKPLVVGGLPHERKAVRARSPEAAAHGILEGMPLRRAHALCPEATFLPPDDDLYLQIFARILQVLDRFSPRVEISQQRTADRGPRTENGGRTADRRPQTEDGGRRTADCGPRTEDRGDKETRGRGELRTQNPEPRTSSGLRTQDSGPRTQDCVANPQPPTPNPQPLAPDTLYLDASGLQLLFGPDEALVRRMAAAVESEVGLRPRVGLAGGKFPAWLAALLASEGEARAVKPGHERAFLAPLPVDLLPCSREMRRRLRLLGLNTLGQLADLPTGALAEQFGPEGVEAHRLARGIDERPVVARSTPRLLEEEIEIDPPTDRSDLLLSHASHLIDHRLAPRLRSGYLACREVTLHLGFSDGSTTCLSTTLHAPTDNPADLRRAVERLLNREELRGTQGNSGELKGTQGGSAGLGESSASGVSGSAPETHQQDSPRPPETPRVPHRPPEFPRVPQSSSEFLRLSLSSFGAGPAEQLGLFRTGADDMKKIRCALEEAETLFGEGALRPLAEAGDEEPPAGPLKVVVDLSGHPLALFLQGRWERVQEVCNRWRLQKDWWRRESWRDYYRILTERGRLCLIYRELGGTRGNSGDLGGSRGASGGLGGSLESLASLGSLRSLRSLGGSEGLRGARREVMDRGWFLERIYA